MFTPNHGETVKPDAAPGEFASGSLAPQVIQLAGAGDLKAMEMGEVFPAIAYYPVETINVEVLHTA